MSFDIHIHYLEDCGTDVTKAESISAYTTTTTTTTTTTGCIYFDFNSLRCDEEKKKKKNEYTNSKMM